jgi:ubiquinone/menaquinone biosynthesis C-methylase UbiE
VFELTRGLGQALYEVNVGTAGELDAQRKDALKQNVAAFYDYVVAARSDTWNWGLDDPGIHEYITARIPGYYRFERDGFCEQLYCYVLRQIPLPPAPGARVLEVGCGPGIGLNFIARLEPEVDFTGLDLSASTVEFAQATLSRAGRLKFIEGDAENLPFGDAEFDAVINVESSHNYPDFARFLGGVERVLEPGGFLSLADMFTANRQKLVEECMQRSSRLQVVSSNDITEKVRAAIRARMQPNSTFRRTQHNNAPRMGALAERAQLMTHGAGVLVEAGSGDLLLRMMVAMGKMMAPRNRELRFESYRHYLLKKRS